MECIRQYFTESSKIFTGNATITNVFTNGWSPSVFCRELKNIYWICHYHQRNKSIGIFSAGFFFYIFFVCTTIGNIFFYRQS